MRHVDDAHHAEGDSEPDGGKEQHRAERKPVPGVLQRVPDQQALLQRSRGRSRGLFHRGRHVRRQARKEPKGFLVAALTDDGNRLELLGVGGAVRIEQHGGAGFDQSLLHARIGFLGDRLVECRQGRNVARLEHCPRRLQALGGIGRHQGQRADRGLEEAAQPVVEAHRREVCGRGAIDRRAGRRVNQLVGLVSNEDAFLLRAEHEASRLQGADHAGSERVAARDHAADAIGGVAEAVRRKAGNRILVGSGTRDRDRGGDETQHEYERDEAVAEGTHP